ncbi:MAG: biotin transporter BioY [Candidatus Zhuqueibacterota bacterium]
MEVISKNRNIILISCFAALTAVGAFIKIPLPHVPVTLQTFFVLLAGNLLGYKNGAFSQVLYLALGLIGIPIFAYGGGPAYIFQPSFGYLLGYPAGAFIIGALIKFLSTKGDDNSRRLNLGSLIFSDVVGVIVIFIFGLGYLYFNIESGLYLRLENLSTPINWSLALKTAVFIFFPIDLVKVILATVVTLKMKHSSVFSQV